MKLTFVNNTSIQISLNNNLLTPVIRGMYKHLRHLPVDFKPWDNPYYVDTKTHEQLVSSLIDFGQKIGVSVDQQPCLDFDQEYYNRIHKIYELNYNGDSKWLDFHEHIHICEFRKKIPKTLVVDYREKAGILEKKFDMAWLKDTVTTVRPGDVYVQWAELGKTPYGYWKNSEPNDFNRMCVLAKPWLKLRAKLHIALESTNFIDHYDVEGFNNWWKDYEQPWCRHWNISTWGIQQIASVSVIGNISDIELVKTNLQKEILPCQIQI
jgi:hypothetical protein